MNSTVVLLAWCGLYHRSSTAAPTAILGLSDMVHTHATRVLANSGQSRQAEAARQPQPGLPLNTQPTQALCTPGRSQQDRARSDTAVAIGAGDNCRIIPIIPPDPRPHLRSPGQSPRSRRQCCRRPPSSGGRHAPAHESAQAGQQGSSSSSSAAAVIVRCLAGGSSNSSSSRDWRCCWLHN